MRVQSLGQEDQEKEIATHSSILAWEIPWTEEPGRLQSLGFQRLGHDRAKQAHTQARRKGREGEKRHGRCGPRAAIVAPKRGVCQPQLTTLTFRSHPGFVACHERLPKHLGGCRPKFTRHSSP